MSCGVLVKEQLDPSEWQTPAVAGIMDATALKVRELCLLAEPARVVDLN